MHCIWDDIAVFSTTWMDCVKHLGIVLQALQKAHLTIKASKCQIGQGSVIYLGHEVVGGRIQQLPRKVQAVQDWSTPKKQTQVRAFLGLTGYYRNFIADYGTIAATLTALTTTKKPKKVSWSEECEKAFQGLKDSL
ncbi:uncharacterized protein [Ambystoma mexicanum]|uniref:uncharacterized protein n=1 Tax=Ambystoma mexicanum TaxID=8296 RepID=UPI0037E78005